MRNELLILFEIFPFVMNFISVLAGVILYFVLKGQRVKRHAARNKDAQ